MPSAFKKLLADKFASNYKINNKALQVKKSWDEVAKFIKADKSRPKK